VNLESMISQNQRDLPSPTERRRLRVDAGLTVAQLATAIGVAPASVSAWEAGERAPQGVHRSAYAEALETLGALLEEEFGR
jgi:DNA-binding transcriptional regulator YiaG